MTENIRNTTEFVSLDTFLKNDFGFSDTTLALLAIIPKVSGVLSAIGSCYVVQDILRSPTKRTQSTFHRTMIGLSIIDIISSVFGNVLSTWPMPKGQHLFAVGSVASCDAVGFLSVLTAVATPLYSCSLATYYLVQLRYNWSDSRIKALEKWFHIVPWTAGLIVAIMGLALKVNGPSPHHCW